VTSNKCPVCGLVNFAENDACRRCSAPLHPVGGLNGDIAQFRPAGGPGRRLLWIAGATVCLLFVGLFSLVVSSDRLGYNDRETVARAIDILDRGGFSKEVFVLRNLATYRGTDNWWNRYVGHQNAYAATNFPFEVLTLYPPFFTVAIDDTERAAILLHESYHLFGGGEERALRGAWLDKQRIGWTEGRYGQTRVWKNTREWTGITVPALFQ
jgi:hypothetical protein